jgi:hypothetical protein
MQEAKGGINNQSLITGFGIRPPAKVSSRGAIGSKYLKTQINLR